MAVRDRLGLTPLFYLERGSRLAFAALPSLLPGSLGVSRRPDTAAVLAHLHSHGPPPGRSFLEGVREVEAGTFRMWNGSRSRSRRYWLPGEPERSAAKEEPAQEEPARELAALLEQVGADHAVDRPAAVSMSGGLDSTAVAAALAAQDRGPLHLIHRNASSLADADERGPAREVARMLGLPLEVVAVDRHLPLSRPEGIETFPDGPLFPPFSDPWESTWRRAREMDVEVVFTGAGGDHLFGGSHQWPYLDLLLTGRWRRLAGDLRRHGERADLPWTTLLRRGLLQPVARLALPRWRPAGRISAPWLPADRRAEWKRVHRQVAFPPGAPRLRLPGHRDRLRFLTHRGSIELLHVLDRQAARHGLELRHPWMDWRFFDFVLSIPSWEVVQQGWSKAILRRAMEGRLPPSVLWAEEKVYPFSLFRKAMTETGAHHVRRLTTGMRAAEAGFVDEVELRAAYDRYCRGAGGGGLIWNALTLEDWLRRYF